MSVAERMTAAEFLAIPDAPRTQLIEGEVVVTEATWLHQFLTLALLRALSDWIDAGASRGAASLPVDVALDDRNVFAPDVLWYPAEIAPGLRDPRPYPLPAIAAEVRSPSTWRYDIGAKKAAYERVGLRELWLVDGEGRSVLVFRRSSAESAAFDVALELAPEDTLASPLLDGFALPLAPLLAR